MEVKAKNIDITSQSAREAQIPLFLGLANEEGYPHEGVADFADSGLDPRTGTLQLRGVFPNQETPPILTPGLFVRVRMPIEKIADALLVDDRALGLDQGGRFVLVVDDQQTVEQRYVKTGSLVEGKRVIIDGLKPDDSVVVKGIQRAIPGRKVDPQTVEEAAAEAKAEKKSADSESKSESETSEPADKKSNSS